MNVHLFNDKVFVSGDEGGWGEVSPLAPRSVETLEDCIGQLQAVQNGWKGALYPSVAFAIESARHPFKHLEWPVAYLFMGTEGMIMHHAEKAEGFSHAKLKIGDFSVADAVRIARRLKERFRLRLDFNSKWSPANVHQFCGHFTPDDFEFLEDPGAAVDGFRVAADEAALGELEVWKPSLKGIPRPHDKLILSSAWESGIGIASIAALAHRLDLPKHPLGIGTYFYLEDDLLESPLRFSKGNIILSPEIKLC